MSSLQQQATQVGQIALQALYAQAVSVIQSTDANGVPTSAFYVPANMGNVYFAGDTSSSTLLQNAVNHCDRKGMAGLPLNDAEKNFLKAIFGSVYAGGIYKGYYEAAILAAHYVYGGGDLLYINADVYQGSAIVQDTMDAMIAYAATTNYTSRDYTEIKSKDPGFLASPQGKAIMRGKRNPNTKGYLNPGGTLLSEQNNQRMKNTDHQFYLKLRLRKQSYMTPLYDAKNWATNTLHARVHGNAQAAGQALGYLGSFDGPGPSTSALSPDYAVSWRVDSLYDFMSYPTKTWTDLPITPKIKVKLPDGLSEYMTHQGCADNFWHYSEW